MPLYDTECLTCGVEQEHVMDRGERVQVAHCVACDMETEHRKLAGLMRPAQYLGDRPCAPQVYGGMYADTMGYRTTGQPPPFELDEINAMSPEDNRAALKSKEYNSWADDEVKMLAENDAKQKRARAIKAGANVDMRTNPLPGDPKL